MKKLKAGQIFPFHVDKLLRLPDGSEAFRLTDPNGVTHLIDASLYKRYNIRTGTLLDARIDHINCAGRIFIEPKHPCYGFGGIFQMEYDSHDDADRHTAFLIDCYGNRIRIPAADLPAGITKGEKVQVIIERIKKGRPVVSTRLSQDNFEEVPPGQWVKFRVGPVVHYENKYDYYLLFDMQGRKYRLRRKFYTRYGFAEGDIIQCRKVTDESGWFFEPKHPEWEPGKRYSFKVLSRTLIDKYPEGSQEALILDNPYGKPVYLPARLLKSPEKIGGTIECFIRDIQYSEPVLSDCC
ncbi:MAG: hypothetical protein Kow00127_03970 [Bacteroidales bacterium]